MRVLAVDASFRRTGAVVLDTEEGRLAFYRFSSRPKDTSWHSLQKAIDEICVAMSPILSTIGVYVFEEPFPHGSYSAGLYALNTALYRTVEASCVIGYSPSTLAHIHGCRKYSKSVSVALAQSLLNALIAYYSLEPLPGTDLMGCTPNIAYAKCMLPTPDQAKAADIDKADPNGLSKTFITHLSHLSHLSRLTHITSTTNTSSSEQHSLSDKRREEKENISLMSNNTRETAKAASAQVLKKPAAKATKPARLSHDEAEALIYLCKASVQHSLVPGALAALLSDLLAPPQIRRLFNA